jgi:hypothetical protein
MGNDIASMCGNCTDSKTAIKFEHVTKPLQPTPKAEMKHSTDSLHKSLERIKNKYESNKSISGDIKTSRGQPNPIPTITEIEQVENINPTPRNNIFHTIQFDDGSTYSGYLKDCKKHGQGKLIFKNGSSYEGEFKDDLYDGFGRFEDSEFIYEGYFMNNKKQGEGTEVNKKGNYKYEGEWKDDFKNGHGKEFLPDMSRYEGNFVNGKKCGKGKLYLSNGTIYDGELQNDKLEGHVKIFVILGNFKMV